MRPLLVVTQQPLRTEFPHLIQRLEHVGIEDFSPIGSVESLDERVLIGFTRWMYRSSTPCSAHQLMNRSAASSGPLSRRSARGVLAKPLSVPAPVD